MTFPLWQLVLGTMGGFIAGFTTAAIFAMTDGDDAEFYCAQMEKKDKVIGELRRKMTEKEIAAKLLIDKI